MKAATAISDALRDVIADIENYGYSPGNPAPWNVALKFSRVGTKTATELCRLGYVLPKPDRSKTTAPALSSDTTAWLLSEFDVATVEQAAAAIADGKITFHGRSSVDHLKLREVFRASGASFPDEVKQKALVNLVTQLRKKLRSHQARDGVEKAKRLAPLLIELARDLRNVAQGNHLD